MATGRRSSTYTSVDQPEGTSLHCSKDGRYPVTRSTTGSRLPSSYSRSAPSRRPRSSASSLGFNNQRIICAISESRGVSPTVGMTFVNLSTAEVVLSQICDTQTYARTCNKLLVFDPSDILIASTCVEPDTKLVTFVRENVVGAKITPLDRKYWSESVGLEFINQLAFHQDQEAIKVALIGNYFTICCLAACLKYIDLALETSFALHSLRIKFQPSEGTMMMDVSTIRSLELIQNVRDPKSTDCLFGLLNETITPMGSRLFRMNLLQPSTSPGVINLRMDALQELTSRETTFFAVRQALKSFLDVDRLLAQLITIPTKSTLQISEQAINSIIQLKQFISCIPSVKHALQDTTSSLLRDIHDFCQSPDISRIEELLQATINPDITYQKSPVDLRNQKCYAVKAGVNGLLDVARQTYKEATVDVHTLCSELSEEFHIQLSLKFEASRGYYFRFTATEIEEAGLPELFVNVVRRKGYVECQTLELLKRNSRISDALSEVFLMSDKTIQDLTENLRGEMFIMYKVCESVALLDMIAAWGQVVTTHEYIRPEITQTLAIKAGRHPVMEKIRKNRFVANDAYTTQQTRFQVITGANMSGKSTYIRQIAMMAIMAQVGCFVPAQYASFPIVKQLFARVSTDNNLEANVSTFAHEMREAAYILQNITADSLVVIDELGRGTSTRDGLAIAVAIAEALIASGAFVYFVTHFRDLSRLLSERPGVISLHLKAEVSLTNSSMNMLYRVADGTNPATQYGLALAKVVDLPPIVLETAEAVSDELHRIAEAKRGKSEAIKTARRRKLILGLREALWLARQGKMEGKELCNWLRRLQSEFVLRMTAIDEEGETHEEEALVD